MYVGIVQMVRIPLVRQILITRVADLGQQLLHLNDDYIKKRMVSGCITPLAWYYKKKLGYFIK